MSCNSSPSSPGRPRDAVIIAQLVALIHARSKGDYIIAAEALRHLKTMGVVVRFSNPSKEVEHE